MQKSRFFKSGFTLVEVLTVVIIIGILSAAGYASLQQAVANSRAKDAAFNIAAFMETASNKANQLSDTVCVKMSSASLLVMVKGSCKNGTEEIGQLEMVVGMNLVSTAVDGFEGSNFAAEGSGTESSAAGAEFVPQLGLAATPTGYFLAQYGSSTLFGAAVKTAKKNAVTPKMSHDGSSWSDL